SFGDRLCIIGNVSNELLRSASPVEIEERVRYLMENVAPGGGYMLGSGNSVAEWSRFENYLAMRAATFRYGGYRG
ncbi:MAG: uroporphyrinogen decarboxylase family protein, partial [Desulfatiglandaceae bacterium]